MVVHNSQQNPWNLFQIDNVEDIVVLLGLKCLALIVPIYAYSPFEL